MDHNVNIKITSAGKLSEIFSLMCLHIVYTAYAFVIFNYLTNFIPSYTPREITILIIIGVFSGFYLLITTRSPNKALWPIIILLSVLFGQYLALHHHKLF